jgi:FKBP-type peptidyl-prolyl cis-trans isomerase FklB
MLRRTIFVFVLSVLSLPLWGAPQTQSAPSNGPKTDKEKLSYSLGVNLARNLQGQNLDLDYPMVVSGIRDGIAGTKQLTDEEIQSIITEFYNNTIKVKLEKQKQLGEQNKKLGAEFLEANKKKPGVVTLPDGLQYKILKEGSGPKPSEADTVKVHYRGTLIDGTEFDSSYERKQPAVFPLDGVIKGWTEALQLMPVGSKWQLFIPSELAYGARQAGEKVPPEATLIFEVELLGIEP